MFIIRLSLSTDERKLLSLWEPSVILDKSHAQLPEFKECRWGSNLLYLLQSYIGKFKTVTKAKLQPFCAYDFKALSYGLV